MSLSRKLILYGVFLIALMIMLYLRVDWWWWGKDMPLIYGWLTLPMIYHLGVWFVGWILVLIVATYFWPDEVVKSEE